MVICHDLILSVLALRCIQNTEYSRVGREILRVEWLN